ncbi:hypothetical protein EX30DRAFT_153629 [Ascodesmis nigricans]|uniref:Uncharacterized protein n=1 Tax=Ascodesmis nigricans TaxID=341454 RepID=A0A4S2N2L7_9PEZI|nr:hypothetical protein EX30DRAFT_153629 [Ascodesmis nigricans]
MALVLSDGTSSLPTLPPLPTSTPNSNSTHSPTLSSSFEYLLPPPSPTASTNLNSTSPLNVSHTGPIFTSSSVKTMSQAVKLAVIFVAVFFVLALIGVGMWRFGSRYIVANYKPNRKDMEKRGKTIRKKKEGKGGKGEGNLEKGEGEGGNQGGGDDAEAGREDGQGGGAPNAG